jgi:hypothetical protein
VDVPDEPSNGELGRGIDRLTTMLTSLVGRAEYNAHQEGIDRRFADLGTIIQEVRQVHADDVRELHQRIGNHEKSETSNRQSWRSILYTGIVPAVLVAVGILVQWIIAHGGGH